MEVKKIDGIIYSGAICLTFDIVYSKTAAVKKEQNFTVQTSALYLAMSLNFGLLTQTTVVRFALNNQNKIMCSHLNIKMYCKFNKD